MRLSEARVADHDLVEQMIVPTIMAIELIVIGKYLCRLEENIPEIHRVQMLLVEAIKYLSKSVNKRRCSRLIDEAHRVAVETLEPLFEKHDIFLHYKIVAVLIEGIAFRDIEKGADNQSHCVLWAMVSEAWDRMACIMGPVFRNDTNIEETANIEARQLRLLLKGMGYFV